MPNLPPDNRNLPPGPDWIEPVEVITAEHADKIDFSSVRWILKRVGEPVMWGEGDVALYFDEFESHDHDASRYAFVRGGAVSPPPRDEWDVRTPDGDSVGTIHGVVSHKMEPGVSPDVRAVRVDGGSDGE